MPNQVWNLVRKILVGEVEDRTTCPIPSSATWLQMLVIGTPRKILLPYLQQVIDGNVKIGDAATQVRNMKAMTKLHELIGNRIVQWIRQKDEAIEPLAAQIPDLVEFAEDKAALDAWRWFKKYGASHADRARMDADLYQSKEFGKRKMPVNFTHVLQLIFF